ncbi:hypothetical protein GCM10009872_51690 [Actinopolymorpha rutila]
MADRAEIEAAGVPGYTVALSPQQRLWSSSDGELPEVLAAGGHGVISGVSSVFSHLFDQPRSELAIGLTHEKLSTPGTRGPKTGRPVTYKTPAGLS